MARHAEMLTNIRPLLVFFIMMLGDKDPTDEDKTTVQLMLRKGADPYLPEYDGPLGPGNRDLWFYETWVGGAFSEVRIVGQRLR